MNKLKKEQTTRQSLKNNYFMQTSLDLEEKAQLKLSFFVDT